MALNQKDRYERVADFVNELRRVVLTLSPLLPTPPKRPIDPHSTQPDLVGLFDALQEAKREANRGSGEASSGTQPVVPPNVANATCPRCGTLLVSNAAFCPSCGMSLGKQINQASSNQQAQMQNIPLEKTQFAVPNEVREAIALHNAGGVQVGNSVSAFSPSNSAQSQQSPLPQWRTVRPSGTQSSIVGTGKRNQNPPQSFTSLLFKYRILIFGILFVVTLLLLIMMQMRR